MAERQLHLIDGWITDDREQFELYTRSSQRGFTYAAQLARDVRSWKPWVFWLSAAACLAFGVLWPDRSVALVGLGLLGSYLFMLRLVVSTSRDGKLIEAVARFTGQHPKLQGLSTGSFYDPKSGARGDTLLETWAVEKFKRADGWVPVLVSYYPKAQTHPVVGVRPVEWQPPAPAVAEGARCARHAENVATGTCVRCGSFVCDYCARPLGEGRICSGCEGKLEVRTPRRLYLALVLAALMLPLNLGAFLRTPLPVVYALVPELSLILWLSWSGRNLMKNQGSDQTPAVAKAVVWLLGLDVVVLLLLLPVLRALHNLRT